MTEAQKLGVAARIGANGGCGSGSDPNALEAALFLRPVSVEALRTEEFRAPVFARALGDAWGICLIKVGL